MPIKFGRHSSTTSNAGSSLRMDHVSFGNRSGRLRQDIQLAVVGTNFLARIFSSSVGLALSTLAKDP